MSFFRDCFESVRGNVRNCLTTPLTTKRLLIFGGVFLAVVLLVVILALTLRSGSSGSTSQGSDALGNGPTTIGFSNTWLKSAYVNKINENLDKIKTLLNLESYITAKLGAMIWAVGASSCADAAQKDAVSQTLEGIDAAHRLAGSIKQMTLASGSSDMTKAKSNSQVAMVLSLDGGYTIDSRLAVLRMFYNLGARILTLTGKCSTPWAGNAASTTKLSNFGKLVIGEANRMGLLLDLAGSSSDVVKDALSTSTAPVIFSGVGSQSLTNVPTNLNNDTLKSLNGKSSVVLVSFKCDAIKSATGCSMDDVINHINTIRELAGAGSVGLAAEFGGAQSDYPTDLADMASVAKLFDRLHTAHNWGMSDLEGLAYNNFVNALQKAAKMADTSKTPADDIEEEAELKTGGSLTCYSDVAIRYQPSPAPTVATTAPTAATAAPTAATTAPTAATTAPTAATTAPTTAPKPPKSP